MIWILVAIALLLSSWTAWSTWQNTKAIKSIFQMIDSMNEIIREIIKHTDMN